MAGSELVTDEWSLLTEVPLRSPRKGPYGRTYDDTVWSNTRTIDVLLTRNWGSGVGFRRVAVEVKVSRSDYRNETDVKREPAERAAHQTYYAAPAGIIDPDTLPAGWGLYEVHPDREAYEAGKGWEVGGFGNGSLMKCRVRPAAREPVCNLEYLVSAAMRRASRAEERIRRGEDDAAAVPALRTEVASLLGKLDRRDEAVQLARSKFKDIQDALAAIEGGQECADCGEPVALDTARYGGWKHRSRSADTACHAARTEANRLAKEVEYGTRYLRGWADPVEPAALRAQRRALDEDYGDPLG